tara:strand:- start:3 stop:752 length:750 start_codon:yes stop_codon:yes gene_type:complete
MSEKPDMIGNINMRLADIEPVDLEKERSEFKFKSCVWGPFVMGLKLPMNFINELVERAQKNKRNDARKALAGHINHEHFYTPDDKDWFMSKMGKIFMAYRHSHEDHFMLHQYLPKDKDGNSIRFPIRFSLESLWINYMQAGEFNPTHNHSGDLSFVIFCQNPDWDEEIKNHVSNSTPPGTLNFCMELSQRGDQKWKEVQHPIFPEVGNMWIFPAELNHEVYPFKTPGVRISVSGNLRFTNKEEYPNRYW